MDGLILDADSPLVQFEVTARAHGAFTKTALGAILWIDRNPRDPESAQFTGEFPCKGPIFRIHTRTDGRPFRRIGGAPFDEKVWPAVCLCMGRFME